MITISLDETHHLKDGKPLYKSRYKKVMSFHNGIAPVEDEDKSFFIDANNNKLFNQTFKKAYGFYENRAAVKDDNGWFHIDKNGDEVYKQRYAWIGNFNENRCVVMDFNDNYFHIDINGNRVYQQNYKYTGDFKYGIAVVIDNSNKSTHIDKFGNLLHGKYFDELGIFHKGLAVAKDNEGYFHVNKKGVALYNQRYAKLEDFYNGYALATTFEGNKIRLDENSLTEIKITEIVINKEKILNDVFSYFEYQILFAILKLDVLKNIKNFKNLELPDISKKLIYRWLITKKIIDKDFNLTPLGNVLENELKDIILYWRDLPFKTSAYMVESLKKGDETFSLFGMEYFDFLEHNEYYKKLSQKINSYYSYDYDSLLHNLNFSNEVICDIGGGNEKLAKNIKKIYPNTKIIVADKFLNSNDNPHIKIDFFKEFKIKSDIFIMSRVLHDWSDEKALLILKNVANNMDKDTKLYLFETIVPDDYKEDKGITLSFHLLNFLGGYERTLDDFKYLLNKVNLEITNIKTGGLISSIEVIKK